MAISDRLARGPLPIEFDQSLNRAEQPDRQAGIITALVLDRGPIASVKWREDVANNLMAWQIRGERPVFVFKMCGENVEVTLAPPNRQEPGETRA
jgi:hypothetical protein